jgi:uncharacterized protein YcfL
MKKILLGMVLALFLLAACGAPTPTPAPAAPEAAGQPVITVYESPT